MKLAFIAALLLGSLSSAQVELNRLQLSNDGDQLVYLNDPFEAGDMFFKVFPEAASTWCSGTWTWSGAEGSLFDQDWSDGAEIYTVVLSPAELTASGVYEPSIGTSADEILIFGGTISWQDLTGQAFDPAFDCPPAGIVQGFRLRETYLDTALGGAATAAFSDIPQGDYAVSQFFPAGQSTSVPNVCGGTGNATFAWLASNDETQPDWTPLPGASAYGGYVSGGITVQDEAHEGTDYALLLDGPILNAVVDPGTGLVPRMGAGLVGLNIPVGMDSAGQLTGDVTAIGFSLFSARSKPTNNANGIGASGQAFVGVVLMNIGPTALEMGLGCSVLPGGVSGVGLNVADSALTVPTYALGLNLFSDGEPFGTDGLSGSTIDWDGNGSADDGVYSSNYLALNPSIGLIDRPLSFQAFALDATSFEGTGSQVYRTTLRASD